MTAKWQNQARLFCWMVLYNFLFQNLILLCSPSLFILQRQYYKKVTQFNFPQS